MLQLCLHHSVLVIHNQFCNTGGGEELQIRLNSIKLDSLLSVFLVSLLVQPNAEQDRTIS